MFIVVTYSQRRFRPQVRDIVDADGWAWVHLKGNAIVKSVSEASEGQAVLDALLELREREDKFDFEWILVSPGTTETYPATEADRPGWRSLERFMGIVEPDWG